jgi:hypothetical protein
MMRALAGISLCLMLRAAPALAQDADINLMAKTNPAIVLGLDP